MGGGRPRDCITIHPPPECRVPLLLPRLGFCHPQLQALFSRGPNIGAKGRRTSISRAVRAQTALISAIGSPGPLPAPSHTPSCDILRVRSNSNFCGFKDLLN